MGNERSWELIIRLSLAAPWATVRRVVWVGVRGGDGGGGAMKFKKNGGDK